MHIAFVEPASAKASSLAGIRGKDALDAPPPVTDTETRVSEFAPPPPTEAPPTATLADTMDKFFDDSNLGSPPHFPPSLPPSPTIYTITITATATRQEADAGAPVHEVHPGVRNKEEGREGLQRANGSVHQVPIRFRLGCLGVCMYCLCVKVQLHGRHRGEASLEEDGDEEEADLHAEVRG